MTNPKPQRAISHPSTEGTETSDCARELLPGIVRKKLGLSMADMAELIGMSEFGYHNWEMGNRRPGGPALKLLALLDVQPKAILDWLKAQ
ncbi:putative zinc finger/helix-turn-helix protein, YgiT family [Shimia thalassica]|uniref:Putative zinc finger/helix-turn-helix protein, YgiT family n=1 Tax=Shimia thalassica TaxID=1715693 RepID=A0A0P1IJ28_9RHOB|nr:helix-turn-helix domain-containing protein [Shimia thalassica]CUK15882.1 putative zinc finger/helix-turn-helix protein, YgiT family [Shimia thalassica]